MQAGVGGHFWRKRLRRWRRRRRAFWTLVGLGMGLVLFAAFWARRSHVDKVTADLQRQIDDLQSQLRGVMKDAGALRRGVQDFGQETQAPEVVFDGNQVSERTVCVDSDADAGKRDVFVRGSAAAWDERGGRSAGQDACAGTGGQVTEFFCAERPFGSGRYAVDQRVYDCPRGCYQGACR